MLQLKDWRLTTYTSTRLNAEPSNKPVEHAEGADEHALAREHADDLPAQHADVPQHAEFGAARERGGTRGKAHARESDDDGDGLERVGDGKGAIEDLQRALAQRRAGQ